MPRLPVPRIRPHIDKRRKRRKGPRIPRPDCRPRRINHPPTINARHRIMRRIKPRLRRIKPLRHRLDQPCLDQIIPIAARKWRQRILGRFRIRKHIRPVRAAINRRTAEFRQPDRLALRHPRRCRRKLHAPDPLAMRIRPPPREILRPPHPGLIHRAIGNRRPRLAIARRSRRIIPLIRLTRAEPRLEIGPVINRSRTARIKMQRPVPPV